MAMGWWKPFFFLDTNGVQLLLPSLVLDGSAKSLVGSALAIALLALLDRYTTHASRSSGAEGDRASVYVAALCYTIQRFTSGLLMLIMMSFNVVLFLEVVLFSGAAELWMKLRTKHREGIDFRRLPSEVEMNDC